MWTVPRKYSEFYVLEQKLTEFHGRYQIFTGALLWKSLFLADK